MSDKEEVLRLGEAEPEAVKEMRRGIMRPPRAATRIMALLVPPGPVTRTRPVGKGFIVVLPGIESRLLETSNAVEVAVVELWMYLTQARRGV